MERLIKILFTAFCCLCLAAGVAFWLANRPWGLLVRSSGPRFDAAAAGDRAIAKGKQANPDEPQQRGKLDVIPQEFEDGGFGVATRYTGKIDDAGSLTQLRDAIRERSCAGLADLRLKLDGLEMVSPPSSKQEFKRFSLQKSLGLLNLYAGNFTEAKGWIEKALAGSKGPDVPASVAAELKALLGIIALRRGEVENCLGCVGPSSCIFPISRDAVHRNQEGSREAVRWFNSYLQDRPEDLRVIWLLDIASMTLGEYPDKVPTRFQIPLELFASKVDVGRFKNVAMQVGLGSRGPNLAGGSIFDDFNGDGLPDLFTTCIDADRGASLFINRGDGTFDDRSTKARIDEQIYALNVTRADYDNDGDLDVLLLRGAWEFPARLSLLRNRGDGTFDDVTIASGLGEPIASEVAAWGDYDNDGRLDLFVGGEYLPPFGDPAASPRDPRNRSRLYRNQGDGTFIDVASKAGVLNERCTKGAAWGDYDDDGHLDLFVSNMRQECRLYRNRGDGTFVDLAGELGVTGPSHSFACWFWDYDNDGLLDLYMSDYRARVSEVVASAAGVSIEGASRPRLYRNLGASGFQDVTDTAGLNRAMSPMGSNFGDIDNDGYLDIYLGTGTMSYSGLVPNVMFKNMEGVYFEDVTTSSGTGHLQKGHGVSFADWDGDGDLDLFVELGGATPGDKAYNALFQNPGHGRHWLKVKLVGTRTNCGALGAKIRADLVLPDGKTRSIYRTVGNNSSFGGNSLVETLGLSEQAVVSELSITWPTSRRTQKFRAVAADQAIEITEGSESFRVLAAKKQPASAYNPRVETPRLPRRGHRHIQG